MGHENIPGTIANSMDSLPKLFRGSKRPVFNQAQTLGLDCLKVFVSCDKANTNPLNMQANYFSFPPKFNDRDYTQPDEDYFNRIRDGIPALMVWEIAWIPSKTGA